ncbi:MAG TPA: DMT family transporter [Anaeromyxobacteraceae bacterium]|nr:DMT family transporter [Anaeromyxobacteraceae bacterium]
MTPAARHGRAIARLELVGCGVFFGLMAVLGRMLSTGPVRFTPGQLSVVRFGVGAAASLAVFAVRPSLYRPRNVPLLLTRGVSGGLVVVLYFTALARIPAGEAGMIYNLFPAIATFMALAALGERPSGRLWLAILLATAGVVLVLGNGTVRLGLGWGEGAALAAAVFAAVSANVIRAMRGTDNAPTIFFFFCLAGLPVVLPFALDPWPAGLVPWALAVAMALSAFAAQVLMTEAYGALSVGEAAAWLQLTPIAQFLLAALLLGEAVTLAGAFGIAVSVAGVAWTTTLGQRAAATPPP